MIKAAIYARYSSDMQKPQSIEDQIRECRKLIDNNKWKVRGEHIFTDYEATGTDNSREGYIALKEAAKRQEFEYIVVDDLSRLGRDTLESITIFSELSILGINIIGVSDGIDTSKPMAKLPYYFRSIMNEMYSDDIRERVSRGMRGQVLRGFSAGGRVFGYKYIDVEDPSGQKGKSGRPKRLGVKIEIDENEAIIVRKIFDMRIKGHGFKAIAGYLNGKAIKSPQSDNLKRSGTWSVSTVRGILLNPKYTGDWTWGKKKWVKIPGTSKRKAVIRPKSEWTLNYCKDLRIIDQAIWDAVQKKFKEYSPKYKPNNGKFTGHQVIGNRGKYLFSGLLRCHKCGGSLIVQTSGDYSVYVCNNNWSRGKSVCSNNARLNRSEVESYLFKSIKKRIINPDVINMIYKSLNSNDSPVMNNNKSGIEKLKKRLKLEQKALDNLHKFVMGGDTSDSIRNLISEKENTIAELKIEIEKAKSVKNTDLTTSKKWIIDKLHNLISIFEDQQDKIQILRQELRSLIVDKIVINPIKIQKGWKIKALVKANLKNQLPLPATVYSGTGNRTPV